ncbi:TPA: hypothetical protein JG914_004666 [Enterobacter hormaechei subsp. steigerwaltii]|nr:hypothetical protein [Enterobacter hormaechei subsp. steigerwaltii]
MHHTRAAGAGYARHQCETLYGRETYFLQIDSHCRFSDFWDEKMISMLESLRKLSPKPILSTYPPDYQPGPPETRAYFPSRLIFNEFTVDGISMQSSCPIKAEAPQRNCYLAGGFIFADGEYLHDVPSDPDIFFAGEEIALSVRAFTHGYDAYAPHNILLWHHYGRTESPKIWSDHTSQAKEVGDVSKTWWERDRESKKRVRRLLGLEAKENGTDLGQFDLGEVRTLQDFEYASGLTFHLRRVHPAVSGAEKCSFFSLESLPAKDDS